MLMDRHIHFYQIHCHHWTPSVKLLWIKRLVLHWIHWTKCIRTYFFFFWKLILYYFQVCWKLFNLLFSLTVKNFMYRVVYNILRQNCLNLKSYLDWIFHDWHYCSYLSPVNYHTLRQMTADTTEDDKNLGLHWARRVIITSWNIFTYNPSPVTLLCKITKSLQRVTPQSCNGQVSEKQNQVTYSTHVHHSMTIWPHCKSSNNKIIL